jgi:hypothetical protein
MSLVQKCKKGVGHAKKVLNLGGTAKDKLTLEDNLIFLGWEEEEMEKGTHTSSKGQSNRSQPNDQTVESPLKKFKKKREKLLIVKRVSNSTKTSVAKVKVKAIKANLGKLK